jgi:phosphate starvation-inducible PhoH-like protein
MFNDDAPDFITGRKKRKRTSHEQTSNLESIKSKKVEIIPRNIAQEEYLDALQDNNISVVFGIGPAGCGKTYLSVLYAIQQLQMGYIDKIVISRPVVTADGSNLGALPGGLCEKMAPYLGAILDILKEFYPVKLLNKMLEEETIQIVPIAVMRGRTFKNCIVIQDEAQDTDVHVMKMILTRIGEGSRMFVTGDLRQADRGFMVQNGLKDFTTRLEQKGGSKYFRVCNFSKEDIERHPAVAEALRIYGEEE